MFVQITNHSVWYLVRFGILMNHLSKKMTEVHPYLFSKYSNAFWPDDRGIGQGWIELEYFDIDFDDRFW